MLTETYHEVCQVDLLIPAIEPHTMLMEPYSGRERKSFRKEQDTSWLIIIRKHKDNDGDERMDDGQCTAT
jgi:hypothetical protein